MIITLKQNAAAEEVSRLRGELEAQGFVIHPVEGTRYNILGLIGDTASLDARQIESLDFVDKVTRIQEPYKKANRKFHPDDSVINVGGVLIGGGHFIPDHTGNLQQQIICQCTHLWPVFDGWAINQLCLRLCLFVAVVYNIIVNVLVKLIRRCCEYHRTLFCGG